MQANVIDQIRRYHGVVTSADKTIVNAGREQIRAAYKCGQLLEKEKAAVRSGQWGKFCARCGMSEDTAGRYIKLSKSADLRDLIEKYRTLNSAYQGEGITSPQRHRITIAAVTTDPPAPVAKPPVSDRSSGCAANDHGKVDSAPGIGAGNTGLDLKAKIRGGGTLGDLLNKVSPAVRADIESQLQRTANNSQVVTASGSAVEPAQDSRKEATPKPRLIDPAALGGEEIAELFQGPLLIEALLLQLNRCAETENRDEIDAWVSYVTPIVSWYEQYAATAEAVAV